VTRAEGPLCGRCLRELRGADLEDGCTFPADCCDRVGLCEGCRAPGAHDCDPAPRWEVRLDPLRPGRPAPGDEVVFARRGRSGLVVRTERVLEVSERGVRLVAEADGVRRAWTWSGRAGWSCEGGEPWSAFLSVR
jgi:hypothetical protein